MSDYRKNIILRFAAVFVVMAIAFTVVIVKIILLQTRDRQALLRLEQKQPKNEIPIEPKRGDIYDANHRVLASSIPTYMLYMDTRVPAQRENNDSLFNLYLDSISIGLAEVVGEKTAPQYKKMIQDAHNRFDGRLKLTEKRISYIQYQDLLNVPLFDKGKNKSGLIIEEGRTRIKPFGSLCSRTVGSVYAADGTGTSGLEKGYEEELHGKPGVGMRTRYNGQNGIATMVEPQNGHSIVTTIDADLQDIVETELRRTLSRVPGEWACCILMEASTGEVKAICNLDKNADGSYSENINHAVVRMEPGSMFKTIALMAALDDGKVSLTDTFHVSNGGWVYQDQKRRINDSHYIKELNGVYTVKQGLTASSNIVLAKTITKAYDKKAERFVSKLESMGLRDTFRCEIPGAQVPRIEVPTDKETLARMSFGYYVELPPLYTLMYYNAIANGGKILSPFIVKAIEDEDGNELKTYNSKVIKNNICSKHALQDIRECLESVVWDSLGTASQRPWSNKAQSKRVHIAGKTGTARVLENGRYLNNRHRIAFCGYFPMEDPQYTCICVIHNVSGADAGRDCGGAVMHIAERTMAHHSLEQERIDADSIPLPAIKRGSHKPLMHISKALGLGVKKSKDEYTVVNSDKTITPITVENETIPSVIGMGARDAVYAIEQTGMIVAISGKGRVVSQSVPAGSKPQRGKVVNLVLK